MSLSAPPPPSTSSSIRRFAKMILDHEHLTLTLLPSLWLVILFNLLNPHLMRCSLVIVRRSLAGGRRFFDFLLLLFSISSHKSRHKYKFTSHHHRLHTIESSRMTIKYFIRQRARASAMELENYAARFRENDTTTTPNQPL
jgi:hypothetical protein